MINPFKTQLHIFQLEGYSPLRFLHWWITHPFIYQVSQKKPLIFTLKVNVLIRYSLLLYSLLLLFSLFFPPLLLLSLLLFFQPFPLLFLSLLLHKPYEIINRQRTIQRIRHQILTHPHLTTIGITGSYGKTSTKDFLYQILSQYHPTLKTPESYNTVFGIARVIDFELVGQLRYFICEMGAYVRGEIKELTAMVPPHYAILTAIGTQHLERFKTLTNTTLAKFELVDAVPLQNALVNLDNDLITTHLKNHPQYDQVKTYSFRDLTADFLVVSVVNTTAGVTFVLRYAQHDYHFTAPIFGTSHLQNLVAAISMSLLLKVPYPIIKSAVIKLKNPPHRLELKPLNPQSTLIDNAYSSNEIGFRQILKDLKKLKGKKALLTPGIIELGGQTQTIHHQLGQEIATVFNTVYLIGRSARTQALEQGLKSQKTKTNIFFLDDHHQLWPTINQLAQTHPWILLENDLTDQY